MTRQRLLVVFGLLAFVSTGVHAQWLNFPTPGTPRTRDGKPDLAAPVPKAADGHPDLSGVWMHELTSVADMRRLYGPSIDAAIKVDVPGMEIGTQHKYALDILVDHPSAATLLRPETVELMKQRAVSSVPRSLAAAAMRRTGGRRACRGRTCAGCRSPSRAHRL